ncbi:MAG: hypothetical protein OEY01_13165 [Desulfobulbaceae bacterium]|nr:hypothetical protein [Desulfobulbaceae bacterium]HIJ79679.1 hypothetical protein [Deltaproteobacteria bacterium]
MIDRKEILEEESLIIRHAGEIPEIAFHSSLYYLGLDPEGPQLQLESEELAQLREQVIARYREIMLRDLEPDNRDKSFYRGVKRCIFNWERLGKFCGREKLPISEDLRREIASALNAFLERETLEVRSGLRTCAINCSKEELLAFAKKLALGLPELPANLGGAD